MKLYWPKAITESGERLHTYDSCMSPEGCKHVFSCWENDYSWLLKEMWIDVTDTENEEYKGRLEVVHDYRICLTE